MNVKELIEELKKYPDDLPVAILTICCGCSGEAETVKRSQEPEDAVVIEG